MKFVFPLLPLALGLLACAPANTVSGTNACERPAPPDREAVWRMAEPGVISTGDPIMPSKNKVGMAECVHQKDDKGNAPQIHDLQKIG